MPRPNRFGHPQVGKSVRDRNPIGSVRLPFEGREMRAVTELLEPDLCSRNGEATPMITTAALPAGDSLVCNVLRNGVAQRDGRPCAAFDNYHVTAVRLVARNLRLTSVGSRRPSRISLLPQAMAVTAMSMMFGLVSLRPDERCAALGPSRLRADVLSMRHRQRC